MYQPRYSDQFTHRYFYDAENRLTEVHTSLDGFTWEREAKYEYYLHGPLARTTLGQQQCLSRLSGIQGMDYAYTLQSLSRHGGSWLKGVNSTGATATHDIGEDGKVGSLNQYVARDALGFNLNYFHGDYQSINAGVSPFPAYRTPANGLPDTEYRPLYNGNISSMVSYIRKFEAVNHNTPIFYNYRYDQLNRYVRQDAYFGFNKTTNSYGAWTPDSTFRERVAYDANGNIQTFVRHAINQGGALMDNLTYKYYPGTNQLRQVNDAVADNSYGTNPSNPVVDIDNQTDTSNYVYDAIGNLIQDKAEKITDIQWNVYGKITEITRNALTTDRVTTTRTRYTYDAQGNRISKVTKYYNKDSAKYKLDYTWYVRDAQGNLLSTYTVDKADTSVADLGTLALKQQDVQLYGSSRLGNLPPPNSVVDQASNTGPWINPDYRGTTYYRGDRQYELTNHLGNVLTIVSDRKIPVYSGSSLNLPGGFTVPIADYFEPDMVSATDYYPFGMVSRAIGGYEKYRYGFNGKENDNEVKGFGQQQDYGMRIYDPRVGRFLSTDPLTKDFPWYTPYQFAGNKPIWATDLDGMEENTSSTYVQKSFAALSNVPKSTSDNTSAGLNLGSFKLDKTGYDYTTWWIPATKAGVFTNNSVVSAWNQAVGTAETGSKLLSPSGRKELKRAALKSILEGIVWAAETTNDEKWDYVKDKATDINTWEDFAGMILLSKGTDWITTPKIETPLLPSARGGLFVKAKNLKLVHAESTIIKSEGYQRIKKLSDKELIESVLNPKEYDPVTINTKTGSVVDGNTRIYEIQRRGLDVDVPVKGYTPNDSAFPDLKEPPKKQ